MAAPLMGAQTAHAQYPPPGPTVTLDRTTVRVGETLTHHGTGFVPLHFVTVQLESHPIVLGHIMIRGDGTEDGTVTIPRRVHPGWHTLRLVERRDHRSASIRIRVLPALGRPGGPGRPGDGDDRPGGGHSHSHYDSFTGRHSASGLSEHRPGLAATGSEKALAVGGVAAALIAAGGGTMLAVRRRRSS
ncbi:hypothetical protein [Streptomyces gibsoniae]|uniref:hypothetical protein n=1 Tax=Streptomyces gibsoniae TaxID=3075529 RepID=UPI002889587F|nr:hypothetical protein [Streptomyces sp. DSM 41699]